MEGSGTIPADSVGQLLYSLGKEYRRDDNTCQFIPPSMLQVEKDTQKPSFKARSHRALVYRRLCMSQWSRSMGKTKWSMQARCEFGCRRLPSSVTPVLNSLRMSEVSVWLACIFSVSPTLAWIETGQREASSHSLQ